MEPSGGLRALPSVDRVLTLLTSDAPRSRKVACARRALDEARSAIRAGGIPPPLETVATRAQEFLQEMDGERLRRVVNATGVVLHTNLGRAPLGDAQLEAVRELTSGYSNLEFAVDEGRRGTRHIHAASLLREVTGAEGALVVNNNAAALLLTMSALCAGREVIVSRGELIEIGGEFRIPELLESSGARLREVGTTNRTHLVDYERAISPDTAAILKVHPSNYRMVGFTSSVAGRDLARLARGRGVCLIHDLGSGLLTPHHAVEGEPVARDALDDGADLVTFSGDKLLGGPQAGVIAGRRDLVERVASHPLMRAVRVDKMTLAALDATLRAYVEGRRDELPVYRMLAASAQELEARATAIAKALAAAPLLKVEVSSLLATTGGGSEPGIELPSFGLRVRHGEMTSAEIQRRLRAGDPPVIGRATDDVVTLDLRTVAPAEDRDLVDRLLDLD